MSSIRTSGCFNSKKPAKKDAKKHPFTLKKLNYKPYIRDMPIHYVVTKKVDKTGGEIKERYYATTKALQKKPVDNNIIAGQLAERSSLQNGDALSVLVQLSDIIAEHLRQGRTVSINGLGNFYPTISSEGVDKPEECTADKVRVSRICFKAAPAFLKRIRMTHFFSFQVRDKRKAVTKKGRKKTEEKSETEAVEKRIGIAQKGI